MALESLVNPKYTPLESPSGRGLGQPSRAVLDMRLRSACCRSSQCFRRLQGWCGPQATLRQE